MNKVLIAAVILVLGFLGLPIPDWLENFVSAVAGILSSIFGMIIKLIQFLLTFGKII